MIKSQLIENLAAKTMHLPEKVVAESVNHLLDLMSDSLKKEQRVEIRGFGSFALRYRPARNAHNPKTGQKLVTSAKYSAHFKPGKELRERINASRARHAIIEDNEN